MLPHHHRIPFYHSNWDDDIVQGDSGKDYLPWPSAVQDGSCFQRPHHVEPQKQEMRLQKNDIKSIRWGCYWVTHFQNCWKTDRNIHHVQKNRFSMPSKKTKQKDTVESTNLSIPKPKKRPNSSPSGRTGEWCGNQTSHSCKGVAQSKDSTSMAWCYIQVIHTDLRRCLRAHPSMKIPFPQCTVDAWNPANHLLLTFAKLGSSSGIFRGPIFWKNSPPTRLWSTCWVDSATPIVYMICVEICI